MRSKEYVNKKTKTWRRLRVLDFSEKLQNLIKRRRSVRLFNGEKIPHEELLSIIEAGIWAPTGCNNQELRFLILGEKEKIDEAIEFKPFFRGVSNFILIFCDMSLPMSHKMYVQNNLEKHLPYVDTGLALANMVLYAKSRGIDSCIVNLSEHHFKISKVKRGLVKRVVKKIRFKLGLHKSMKENFEFYLRNHLKIPKNFKIMCGVAFGYAKKYPDVKTEMHVHKKILRETVDHYII